MDDVTLSQSAFKVVTARGKVVERSPALNKITFRVWLGRSGSDWTVVGWKTVKA